MSRKVKQMITAVLAVMILVGLDQYTKYLAETHLRVGGGITVIKNVFRFQYLQNMGAAFGIFQGQRVIFLCLTALTIVAVCYVYTRLPEDKTFHWMRLTIILMVSGAVGNAVDRALNGYVIDFLYFQLIDFPTFNVADCYVTLSAVLLVYLIIFYHKDEEWKFLSWKKKS